MGVTAGVEIGSELLGADAGAAAAGAGLADAGAAAAGAGLADAGAGAAAAAGAGLADAGAGAAAAAGGSALADAGLGAGLGMAGGAGALSAFVPAADALSFIPAADAAASLSPELATALGVSSPVAALPGVDAALSPALDTSGTNLFASDVPGDAASFSNVGGTGPSALDQVTSGVKDFGASALSAVKKNPLQALGVGAGLLTALNKPKLPSQFGTVSNTNTALMQQAQGVISSGGTSAPGWAQQKASIDASIDQQLQQITQQTLQQQINSGAGANSMVTQQALASVKQRLEAQRQQLYQQQLATNVQQAIQEISGGNSALTAIGTTQLQENQRAQQIGMELALQSALLGQTGQSARTGT